jgi:hypothetical protein
VRGQRHAPAALYPRERPGSHCTGGWVGPRAGLDKCGKSRLHRDSITGPSRPYPVAIGTTLPGPQSYKIQGELKILTLVWKIFFNQIDATWPLLQDSQLLFLVTDRMLRLFIVIVMPVWLRSKYLHCFLSPLLILVYFCNYTFDIFGGCIALQDERSRVQFQMSLDLISMDPCIIIKIV